MNRCLLVFLFLFSLSFGFGCSETTAGDGAADEGSEASADLQEEEGGESGTGAGVEARVTPTINSQDDFGTPCNENSDCLSGYCVESPDGYICTKSCLEECPDGFACKAVANLGPDTIFLCIPDFEANPCDGKANGAVCEDGNACTSQDKCQDGLCIGGPPPDCDDGNPCTDSTCNFKFGCDPFPVDGDCEDDDVCTVGGTCVEGACVGGGVMDCDDGDPCTEDACDPVDGCVFPPMNCDDGVVGTLDLCLEDGCENIETCDGLEKPSTVCVLTGSKGDMITCDLQVLSMEEGVGVANSLQVQLMYPDNLAKVMYMSACATCTDPLVGGMNIPSGHFLTYSPATIDDWAGSGELILVSLSAPYPLTDAYGDISDPVGDAQVLTVHFELKEAIDAPVSVLAQNVVMGDADGAPLVTAVQDLSILTSAYAVPCEVSGDACDDQNACTEADSCVAKLCVGEEKPCDDGEICTFDFCDPATGCYHKAVEDGCACHDGDVCTWAGSCEQGACEITVFPGCE